MNGHRYESAHVRPEEVEHFGFGLNFSDSSIRDRDRNVISVPLACIKLFSLISTDAQTYDELLTKYNSLQEIDSQYKGNFGASGYKCLSAVPKKISEASFRTTLSHLEV